jgi:hypothetical protein
MSRQALPFHWLANRHEVGHGLTEVTPTIHSLSVPDADTEIVSDGEG